jgi:phosphatidylinositol glycan class O
MARKLNESDRIVEHVFNSMSADTLLVIFGDHGMTSTGDHGGDSRDETEAAIIFLSKQKERQRQINPPFQCSKQLSISQIDLVPTLASLIGIPVPYSNIGQIIPDFLPNRIYSDSVAANVAQVQKYIQHFPTILSSGRSENGESLEEQYIKIEEAFSEYQSSRNSTTRARLHALSMNYLMQVKEIAVSTWTQFNVPMIYLGITISLLSVVSLLLYLAIVPKLFLGSSALNNYTVLSWLWPSLSHWAVLWTFVYHPSANSGVIGIAVSTVSGLSVFLSILLFKSFKIVFHKYRKRTKAASFSPRVIFSDLTISEVTAVVVYLFTCLVVFSNSFVINEGSLLGATLIFVVLVSVICPRGTSNEDEGTAEGGNKSSNNAADNLLRMSSVRKRIKCTWSCFISLAVSVRISAIYFRCREEQVTCTEVIKCHIPF